MLKHRIDAEALSRLPHSEQVDLVCDAFESEWKLGNCPDPAEYASLLGERTSELLRELILIEIECAKYFPRPTACEDSSELSPTSMGFKRDTVVIRHQQSEKLPARFGKYMLLERIGSGSYGTVYKAEDVELQRVIAIKLPKLRHGSSDDVTRDLLDEAKAVANLNHEGIVAILEVGNWEGTPFITSEFIAGPNLRDWLEQQTTLPAPREIVGFIAKLCDSVAYAHSRNVIHRDLKPSNIVLKAFDESCAAKYSGELSEYSPRLLDFGIAKFLNSESTSTLTGEVLGTPMYMSPEQARGESKSADARSDVYSIGAILFEMLARRTVYEGSPSQIISQVLSPDEFFPQVHCKNVSAELLAICQKCLCKTPEKRYANAELLAKDLRYWLHGNRSFSIRLRPLAFYIKRNARAVTNKYPMIATVLLMVTIATWWIGSKPNTTDIDGARMLGLGSFRATETSDVPKPKLRPEEFVKKLVAMDRLDSSLLHSFSSYSPQELMSLIESLDSSSGITDAAFQEAFNSEHVDPNAGFRLGLLLAQRSTTFLQDSGNRAKFVHLLLNGLPSELASEWNHLVLPAIQSLESMLVESCILEKDRQKRNDFIQLLSKIPISAEGMVNGLRSCETLDIRLWIRGLCISQSEGQEAVGKALVKLEPQLEENQESHFETKARLLLAKFAFGDEAAAREALKHSEDPRVRTYFVHQFSASSISISKLLSLLERETEHSIQYGAIIALGLCTPERFSEHERAQFISWVLHNYESTSDSGVHSACLWLLVNWNHTEPLKEIDNRLLAQGDDGSREWYFNSLGMLMIKIRPPMEFWFGDPNEEENLKETNLARVELRFPLAVSAFEISDPEFAQVMHGQQNAALSRNRISARNISLLDAVEFCRALDDFDLFGDTQHASEIMSSIEVSFCPSSGGYRLPFAEEWECICRANTKTSRFYGSSQTPYWQDYCRFCDDTVRLVAKLTIPNDIGVFDTLGGVGEWTGTPYSRRRTGGLNFGEKQTIELKRANWYYDGMQSSNPQATGPGKPAPLVCNRRSDSLGFRVVRTLIE